jgi:hypothetical protein
VGHRPPHLYSPQSSPGSTRSDWPLASPIPTFRRREAISVATRVAARDHVKKCLRVCVQYRVDKPDSGLASGQSVLAYPDVAAVGDKVVIYNRGMAVSIGGTSASAPVFAAILTRINEERLAAGCRYRYSPRSCCCLRSHSMGMRAGPCQSNQQQPEPDIQVPCKCC